MKALLLLAVIFIGVWLWRSRQDGLNRPVAPPEPPKPLDMVPCVQCGLHVAVGDAVQGCQGLYCSQAHLKQSEG